MEQDAGTVRVYPLTGTRNSLSQRMGEGDPDAESTFKLLSNMMVYMRRNNARPACICCQLEIDTQELADSGSVVALLHSPHSCVGIACERCAGHSIGHFRALFNEYIARAEMDSGGKEGMVAVQRPAAAPPGSRSVH